MSKQLQIEFWCIESNNPLSVNLPRIFCWHLSWQVFLISSLTTLPSPQIFADFLCPVVRGQIHVCAYQGWARSSHTVLWDHCPDLPGSFQLTGSPSSRSSDYKSRALISLLCHALPMTVSAISSVVLGVLVPFLNLLAINLHFYVPQ